MPTLTPSSGVTNCTVMVNKFSYTYDGNKYTRCGFKTGQACASHWLWDVPVNVNAVEFNAEFYNTPGKSHIFKIYGKSTDGKWTTLWSGKLYLPYQQWYSHAVSCENCIGIEIASYHVEPMPYIREVRIKYTGVPPQGKMVITNLEYPEEFVPNVAFAMHVTFRNDGGEDGYFCRIYDRDLGGVIASTTGEPTIKSGETKRIRFLLNLSQKTDFHGRAEVGHFE